MLVAAQKPQRGSTLSTWVAADHVSVDRLNEHLHDMLVPSRFAEAFFLLETEGVVFGWSRAERWRKMVDQRAVLDPARVEALRRKLRLSES